MLKLYTDTSFLTQTHRREVFPLLFDIHFKQSEKLSKYYDLVNTVEASDIVVLPINYATFFKHKKALKSLLQVAKKHKKHLWVYTAGDFGFTNYIPNSSTFRLGGFKSQLDKNSFIIPSFINDPYLTQIPDGFSVLEKTIQPTIGFVGHAQTGMAKFIKESLGHFKTNVKRYLKKILADKQSFYPSSIKRFLYLSVLGEDSRLKTNFILRNNYRAGVTSATDKEKSTTEFYENMFNNAYTFCSRGVGNFSVRFYETLAMGRIPILLNTDCKLPLESQIDWKTHCIIIEEKDLTKMPNKILEFHNGISDKDFQALQLNNRELWETKLMRHHYFIEIHDIFVKKLKANE